MESEITIPTWAWVVITSVLAGGLWGFAVVAVVLSVKRRRAAFLGVAAMLLVLGAVAALANPVANLIIFDRVAEQNTERLFAQMSQRGLDGMTPDQAVSVFGHPQTIRKETGQEIWLYDPNPWFMIGWTKIGVTIQTNHVVGHWLDD